MNYEIYMNIEEKGFPHLFSKGVFGYMSLYFPERLHFLIISKRDLMVLIEEIV